MTIYPRVSTLRIDANAILDSRPSLAALNDFAGVRRYEEGRMVYEPEDLEDVRAMTEELLTWAEAVRAR